MRPITLLIALAIGVLALNGCEMPVDRKEYRPGLHLARDFANDYELISAEPDASLINKTMTDLDWEKGFHQIRLVREHGIWIEVGGSLNPRHGLTAVFQDRNQDILQIIVDKPESVSTLTAILLSFHAEDGKWRDKHTFR